MSWFWRHDGPCVIILTPKGQTSERLAAMLQLFGDAKIKATGLVWKEGNELRIKSGGGCQQSVDSITLSFSPKATDCAFLQEDEIKEITTPDGGRIWPPAFVES